MAQIALKLLYETRMESNSHAVASDVYQRGSDALIKKSSRNQFIHTMPEYALFVIFRLSACNGRALLLLWTMLWCCK